MSASSSSSNNPSTSIATSRRGEKRPDEVEKLAKAHPCFCNDDSCQQSMIDIGRINPKRVGYLKFPKQLVPRPRSNMNVVNLSAQRRLLWLRDLHRSPQDLAGKDPSNTYVALAHFPPALFDSTFTGSAGESILKTVDNKTAKDLGLPLGNLIHGQDPLCGQYIMSPSYSCQDMQEELQQARRGARAIEILEGRLASAPNTSRSSLTSRESASRNSLSRSSLGSTSSLSSTMDSDIQLSRDETRTMRRLEELSLEEIAIYTTNLQGKVSEAESKQAEEKEWRNQAETKLEDLAYLTKAITEKFPTRLSITSDAYHAAAPEMAKYMFGLGNSWAECKAYLFALFGVEAPDKDPAQFARSIVRNEQSPLTPCEELLLTKMRFRKGFENKFLAAMWGKSEPVVSRIVHRRVGDWGNAGLDLSILDLTTEFLALDLPEEYKDGDFQKVSALVDGKCYRTETFRKDSKKSRAQWANKVEVH